MTLHEEFEAFGHSFLVMPYCPGEMFNHIFMKRTLDEDEVRFYAACLVQGLSDFQSFGYLHRDIKPENILIDSKGYPIISDYGISGKETDKFVNTYTPCYGSPEQISISMTCPETLKGFRMSDWWQLGITFYQMLAGDVPFQDENIEKCAEKIMNEEPEMMAYFEDETIDFLESILQKDETKRLGYNGVEEIKAHPFFAEIDWDEIMERKLVPEFIPDMPDFDSMEEIEYNFKAHSLN